MEAAFASRDRVSATRAGSCASSQGNAYNRANRPYSAKWRSKAMTSVIPRRAMTMKLMASQSE